MENTDLVIKKKHLIVAFKGMVDELIADEKKNECSYVSPFWHRPHSAQKANVLIDLEKRHMEFRK